MVWLGGILGGALMGMAFVAHLSALFALRPPKVLADHAPEATLVPLVMVMSVFFLTTWLGLGVAAAFAFELARTRLSIAVPGMPSVVYTAGVVGLALLALPILLLSIRRRGAHVAAEVLLFTGIFGWLVPAMVSAG